MKNKNRGEFSKFIDESIAMIFIVGMLIILLAAVFLIYMLAAFMFIIPIYAEINYYPGLYSLALVTYPIGIFIILIMREWWA